MIMSIVIFFIKWSWSSPSSPAESTWWCAPAAVGEGGRWRERGGHLQPGLGRWEGPWWFDIVTDSNHYIIMIIIIMACQHIRRTTVVSPDNTKQVEEETAGGGAGHPPTPPPKSQSEILINLFTFSIQMSLLQGTAIFTSLTIFHEFQNFHVSWLCSAVFRCKAKRLKVE